MTLITLYDEGMSTDIAGEFMKGIADGKEKQVLETLALVGEKFVRRESAE